MTMNLEEIEKRVTAATQGPWHWSGNVDYSDPILSTWLPGLGRCNVMSHFDVERSADSRQADEYRSYLFDCGDLITQQDRADIQDAITLDTTITDDSEAEDLYEKRCEALIKERVEEAVADWLTDQYGAPIRESRLAFADEHNMMHEARKMAIFEVARDVTDRDDPKVYRADIVGLRHPDADFIAHSRQDVEDLIAEVKRLRALVGEHA